MNGNEPTKFDKAQADEIVRKFDLNFLALFGSQTDGTAGSDSDYDIVYSGRDELGYAREVELSEDLARLFKSKKIDLVDAKKAGPLLMYEIAKHPLLLSEGTKNSFDNYQIYCFMRYFDAKPLLRMQAEAVSECC